MNYGTEQIPNGVKKLVQVSEEIQKPVHVPVVLGNECFVVTQQDIRRIEDIRFISYHKLGPNGELIPIDADVGQDCALKDAIMSAASFQNQNQGGTAARQFLEMLAKCCGKGPKADANANANTQQAEIKASIAQQMEWANAPNSTSPPYPFTYSQATSVDDLPQRCCDQPCSCCCRRPTYVVHKGCNTLEEDPTADQIEGPPSAREMLKMRKMIEDTMGV